MQTVVQTGVQTMVCGEECGVGYTMPCSVHHGAKKHGGQIKFRAPSVAMVARGNPLRSYARVDATGWVEQIAQGLLGGTPGDVVGRWRTCARGRDRDGEDGPPALIYKGPGQPSGTRLNVITTGLGRGPQRADIHEARSAACSRM